MAKKTVTIDLSATLDKIDTELQRHKDTVDEIVARGVNEDRDFTPEEETAIGAEQDSMKSLQKRRAIIARTVYGDDVEDRGDGKPRTLPSRKSADERFDDDLESDAKKKKAGEYRKAFEGYLRYGKEMLQAEQRSALQEGYAALDMNNPEVRALAALTGKAGGFTVPEGFVADIEVAMKSYSGIRQSNATIMPTSAGNDLPWPTTNDTSNEGEIVNENSTTSNQDVAFGAVILKAHLFSSKIILVPIQLLQDTGINIENVLAGMMGERLGRVTNRYFTVGTNANQPQGLIPAVPTVNAGSSTAIAYADFVEIQHSVDPAYRVAGQFMLHDSIVKAAKKLLDSQGRPIWLPNYESGMDKKFPGTILGDPFVINQNMDSTMATGKKTIAYGNLAKFIVRDVKGMTIVRLSERYAEKFQIAFFAFMRCDSKLLDAGTNPIKVLVHP